MLIAWPAHGGEGAAQNCDSAAAHVEDNQKHRKGLRDNDVDPVLAIKHCLEAVLKRPEIARFHFQLGRGYWLSQKYKEAVSQFRQAAEMRYPAAAAYLGEAYEKGLGGLKKDQQKAKKYYERAIAGKFTPAELLLANLVKAQQDADQKSAVSVPLEPVLTPRPSIWEHGIPDPPPQVNRILLTGETVALLALKNQPTLDIPALWEFLVRRQMANDHAYYKRLSSARGGGLEWGARWDPKTSQGYHPVYVPFCPTSFFADLSGDRAESMEDQLLDYTDLPRFILTDQNAMEAFKSWMLKRAETLPTEMVLPARFYMKELIFDEFGVKGSENASQDDVFSQLGYPRVQIQRLRSYDVFSQPGYPRAQIQRLGEYHGREIGIPAGLLLPNIKRVYEQHVAEVASKEQEDVWVEFEVVVKKVDLPKAGPYQEIALIHLDPTQLRLISLIDYSVMQKVHIK